MRAYTQQSTPPNGSNGTDQKPIENPQFASFRCRNGIHAELTDSTLNGSNGSNVCQFNILSSCIKGIRRWLPTINQPSNNTIFDSLAYNSVRLSACRSVKESKSECYRKRDSILDINTKPFSHAVCSKQSMLSLRFYVHTTGFLALLCYRVAWC